MIRAAILTAIQSQLTTITIANGYNTDLGARVFYWHDLPFEYGEQGALSIRDTETLIAEVNQRFHHEITIELEAVAFTDDPLMTGCNMLSDLIRCIGIDPTWGRQATQTQPTRTETIVETQGKTAIRVLLAMTVSYRSDRYAV